MNVDWNWIKQRPQFLAEGLAKKYDLDVIYRYKYNRKGLTKDKFRKQFTLTPIYTIPFINNKYLKKINSWIVNQVIKKKINTMNPDFIYLTNPEQIQAIPNNCKSIIIYDCMDYHHAFLNDLSESKKIISDELKLVKRADIILASSQKLKDNLINDYSLTKEIYVVRNGYNGKVLSESQIILPTISTKLTKITYIGTISHWFDFDTLLKSLEDFPNIEYEIVGPISKTTVPYHKRLKFLGSIPHEQLTDIVRDTDVLIMPFQVNDIVEAVDPVKLYEYINFNKNIISVRYDEVLRFSPFVHFYSDYTEYKRVLEQLICSSSLTYSLSQRYEFLEKNTWENRVQMIERILAVFDLGRDCNAREN